MTRAWQCSALAAAAVLVCLAGAGGAQAQSQVAPTARTRTAAVTPAAGATSAAYYIEFRAAEMGLYGHSYIAYGRLGPVGRPLTVDYADFHPAGGELGLAVGHLVPVVAGMTPDRDVLALPLTSAYRRRITAAEYRTLTAAVARARATPSVWNALAYNCNSFVGEMAQAIGLKSPSPLLFANAFVPALRDLNETAAPVREPAAVKPRVPARASRLPPRS